MDISDPKQVIIIRTDTEPKMRKGKMIAQGAHASMKVIFDMMYVEPFRNHYERRLSVGYETPLDMWVSKIFKKVVVGATKKELVECYQNAKKAGIPCALIEDKGLTEFGGEVTITACAVGPALPEKIDPITGHLKLL